ncbi:glycosyltransferase [Aeromonas sp. 601115]|uniref:glycosyltransferase n=1 Tax=Aeromonas sp. 601115 TaxID=2712038 RepID=UPI003BA172B6
MTLVINHVMSAEISSGIFSDLLSYYKSFCDRDIKIVETVKPIEHADIYHYHRPHLEEKLKKNSVVTVHHDLNDTDKWLSYDRFHDRYAEATVIFCLNKTQENLLHSKGLMHTKVIPHGYNSKIFSNISSPKTINGKVTIGIVSKRYGRKVKGEAYLLELYKRLDSEKFKFIFVGADRSISSWKAREYGFETEVFERLPYLCFGDLYKSLNFLLITSLYEGGPANIPEAIVSGTPIISNPIGMSNDYVQHNVNGILLTGNVDYDADIISSYSEENSYKRLSLGAIKQQKMAKTWEEVMRMTSSEYKKISKGNF